MTRIRCQNQPHDTPVLQMPLCFNRRIHSIVLAAAIEPPALVTTWVSLSLLCRKQLCNVTESLQQSFGKNMQSLPILFPFRTS